ncbi:hypothetical protein N9O25_01735 [Flavobacteriaceae bacterium]|nr:hypothetical protein [Flavobacteriaceae bacterium]
MATFKFKTQLGGQNNFFGPMFDVVKITPFSTVTSRVFVLEGERTVMKSASLAQLLKRTPVNTKKNQIYEFIHIKILKHLLGVNLNSLLVDIFIKPI